MWATELKLCLREQLFIYQFYFRASAVFTSADFFPHLSTEQTADKLSW